MRAASNTWAQTELTLRAKQVWCKFTGGKYNNTPAPLSEQIHASSQRIGSKSESYHTSWDWCSVIACHVTQGDVLTRHTVPPETAEDNRENTTSSSALYFRIKDTDSCKRVRQIWPVFNIVTCSLAKLLFACLLPAGCLESTSSCYSEHKCNATEYLGKNNHTSTCKSMNWLLPRYL